MGLETKLLKQSKKLAAPEDFTFEFGPLKITQSAYNKMRKYQQLYDTLNNGKGVEFYAYMISPKDSPDVITDIFLAPRQDNTHSHTEVDEEGVGLSARLIEAQGNRIRGWTHYHPGSGWFFSSGEDKENHNMLVTALIYNKKIISRKKQYKPTKVEIKENKLVAHNEFLGETIELDTSLFKESQLEELMNNLVFKKDSYKSMLYCYSMILVGNDREYVELITFDTKTKNVNIKQTSIEFVNDTNPLVYPDKDLLVHLMTRIKYDVPLIKVIKNIQDKKLMIEVWREIKRISKEEKLPTELYPKKIFKPKTQPQLEKQGETAKPAEVGKKQETGPETKVTEPVKEEQKTDEAIIKELQPPTYQEYVNNLTAKLKGTIKQILKKIGGRQI